MQDNHSVNFGQPPILEYQGLRSASARLHELQTTINFRIQGIPFESEVDFQG